MRDNEKKRTFLFILSLYFAIYYCLGILPANIDNIISTLRGTTRFGAGFIITSGLISTTVSMLVFGYVSESLSNKYGRKKLFIMTNAIWIIANGLIAVSLNYSLFLYKHSIQKIDENLKEAAEIKYFIDNLHNTDKHSKNNFNPENYRICRECNSIIERKDKSCPYCGAS